MRKRDGYRQKYMTWLQCRICADQFTIWSAVFVSLIYPLLRNVAVVLCAHWYTLHILHTSVHFAHFAHIVHFAHFAHICVLCTFCTFCALCTHFYTLLGSFFFYRQTIDRNMTREEAITGI